MNKNIEFVRASKWSQVADWLMIPLMYLLSGTFTELPQRTHFWNNLKYASVELSDLDINKSVFSPADPEANRPWFSYLPLFHMKIFGGWRKYVVLAPVEYHGEWFVGWRSDDSVNGISQIPLTGPVRLLIGTDDIWFVGIKENTEQIGIMQIGEGEIGEESQFSQVPLL